MVSAGLVSFDLTEKLLQRFWGYVNKTDGCWLWTKGKWVYGYGYFCLPEGLRGAHRISYFLANGSYDATKYVCHKCDVRLCLRPDHLFLGTQSDNILDMYAKGRGPAGSKHKRSKLTEEQVLAMRAEYMGCRGEWARLSRKYGVDDTLVTRIIKRKVWKHI